MKKLLVPSIQSQRDSRWASVILGNNNLSQFNIGQYGCLITSFANYLGKTPVDINNVKALFTSGGGDFIWGQSALIGLKSVYTSPRYDDAVTSQAIAKMKSLIDEGRPLICEIDFNPNTVQEDQHYILIIGYDDSNPDSEEFIAVDPWTGQVISASVYGGIKRMLYTFRAYDKVLPFDTGADYFLGIDLNNKESIKVCVQTWKDVIDKKYIKVEDCQIKIDEATKPLNQKIEDDGKTIINLNGQIDDLTKQNKTLSDDLKVCQEKADANAGCPKELFDKTQEFNQLKQNAEENKGAWTIKEINYQKQIKTIQTRLDAFKSPSKKLLVDIWESITGKK